MNKRIIMKVFPLLLAIVSTCLTVGCTGSLAGSEAERADANSVEAVLERLKKQTAELKSYQCRIEYLFRQPLFESQTLRTGFLYYQKYGEKSKLRINFQTLKQDDEEERKHIEHYIFDGTWLTKIDYQIKQVTRKQLAEPNQPKDAFELVSEHFPIIGFSRIEDLKKQFEISLLPADKSKPGLIRLHLEVKPDSIYKDDYTYIEFGIDKELGLPHGIFAMSVEEDLYAIRLRNAKVNEKIDKEVFEFKIPEGFSKEITPLKKKPK